MKVKAIVCLIIIAAISACDENTGERSLASQDRQFIREAAHANRAEIEFGKLAATQTSTPEVLEFGQHMVDEHQLAQEEVVAIADDEDVVITDELNETHQEAIQRLKSLTGHQFDTAYMHLQIQDHQRTENLFENEISSGEAAHIKAYAEKYLPQIRAHRRQAEAISNKLKP